MREVGFISPVYVDDVMSFYAQVLGEGPDCPSDRRGGRSKEPRRHIKVTEAEVIYVAVDEAGDPIPIR
jgi:acyl-CoA hydrolase